MQNCTVMLCSGWVVYVFECVMGKVFMRFLCFIVDISQKGDIAQKDISQKGDMLVSRPNKLSAMKIRHVDKHAGGPHF